MAVYKVHQSNFLPYKNFTSSLAFVLKTSSIKW